MSYILQREDGFVQKSCRTIGLILTILCTCFRIIASVAMPPSPFHITIRRAWPIGKRRRINLVYGGVGQDFLPWQGLDKRHPFARFPWVPGRLSYPTCPIWGVRVVVAVSPSEEKSCRSPAAEAQKRNRCPWQTKKRGSNFVSMLRPLE